MGSRRVSRPAAVIVGLLLTLQATAVLARQAPQPAQCRARPSSDFAMTTQDTQPAKDLLFKETTDIGLDGRKILDETTAEVE